MKPEIGLGVVWVFAWLGGGLGARAADRLPVEWIDPATGHRIIRLSRQAGSISLYFTQNAYTARGDKLLMVTPQGLATVNLETRAIDLVVRGVRPWFGGSSGIEVGRRHRRVYYTRRLGGHIVIFATDLDTKATRRIIQLPFAGTFGGVNADETLLVGAYNAGPTGPANPPAAPGAGPAARPEQRQAPDRQAQRRWTWSHPRPRRMRLFSVDIQTGKVRTFHPDTNWLNHVQCSPTDPTLIMFCHEGPWHQVDRIWTIRVGSDSARLMFRRTMPYEIAGHEFFSGDGGWIWFDLQTPRSAVFWLAGVNVKTGEEIRYPIRRREWSVHYNIAPDGRLFAGDGGGPNSVANRAPLPDGRRFNPPRNGQWIYLFRPHTGQFKPLQAGNRRVQVGRLDVEKLVDLSRHNYRLEPNVTFTPDGKWVVFRSNMLGPTEVYAVEVAKASGG